MRKIVLALAVVLALPAAASARGHHKSVFPTGNSGINQYLEVVPSATGGQPANTIHTHHNGGGGAAGGGGSSGSSGGGPSGGAVAPSTTHALASSGALGSTAAALAQASAPSGVHGISSSTGSHTRAHGNEPPAASQGAVPHHSTASGVLDAFTGSASHGGLGSLLPALLIVCAVGAIVAVIRRRPRAT
jgi:hypothetical protein